MSTAMRPPGRGEWPGPWRWKPSHHGSSLADDDVEDPVAGFGELVREQRARAGPGLDERGAGGRGERAVGVAGRLVAGLGDVAFEHVEAHRLAFGTVLVEGREHVGGRGGRADRGAVGPGERRRDRHVGGHGPL
jgi:hypothetical protein